MHPARNYPYSSVMHILLLEPDPALAADYVKALQNKGLSVVHASDAQTAITYFDEQQFDAIIIELLLKKHNGIEFLYELRSYDDGQAIPIIIHTYVRPDQFTTDESLLKELGIKAYLYKPETSLLQLTETALQVGRKQ